MADEDGKNVQLKWVIPDSLVPEFVNHIAIQRLERDYLISFFLARPPLIFGSEEERRKQVEEIEYVAVNCRSQIIVTPEKLEEFLAVLIQADNVAPTFQQRTESPEDSHPKS